MYCLIFKTDLNIQYLILQKPQTKNDSYSVVKLSTFAHAEGFLWLLLFDSWARIYCIKIARISVAILISRPQETFSIETPMNQHSLV